MSARTLLGLCIGVFLIVLGAALIIICSHSTACNMPGTFTAIVSVSMAVTMSGVAVITGTFGIARPEVHPTPSLTTLPAVTETKPETKKE